MSKFWRLSFSDCLLRKSERHWSGRRTNCLRRSACSVGRWARSSRPDCRANPLSERRYGAALQSWQSYGLTIQNRIAGDWVENQQTATALTARIWVQDGNIMGFVAQKEFFENGAGCFRAESTPQPFRRAGADRLPGEEDPDEGRGSARIDAEHVALKK